MPLPQIYHIIPHLQAGWGVQAVGGWNCQVPAGTVCRRAAAEVSAATKQAPTHLGHIHARCLLRHCQPGIVFQLPPAAVRAPLALALPALLRCRGCWLPALLGLLPSFNLLPLAAAGTRRRGAPAGPGLFFTLRRLLQEREERGAAALLATGVQAACLLQSPI